MADDKMARTIRDLLKVGDLSRKNTTKALDWIDHINYFELAPLTAIHERQGRTVATVYVDTSTVAIHATSTDRKPVTTLCSKIHLKKTLILLPQPLVR